eukprot:TRINITY_DN3501_c0_g1_i3.p1 TRINITY_DN3501_c0_g1~~TRINITY_DN3501_c0_g1_i3.p1  ORF type:complete len:426 (-),score=70.29 TRINITY_DN3501_c0_g1_i3:224-1501(-)
MPASSLRKLIPSAGRAIASASAARQIQPPAESSFHVRLQKIAISQRNLHQATLPNTGHTARATQIQHIRHDNSAGVDEESFDDLSHASPVETVRWAASTGPVAMISSFGAQAAVLLHMANQVTPGLPVIAIDTGYLPPETYRYMEQLREALSLNLIVVNNPEWSPARMEAIYGKLWEQNSQDAHTLYGRLRKTAPLETALRALEPAPTILLSGVRASQTRARAGMPRVARQADGRLKVLPLLHMSDEDVLEYMAQHDLPRHPLVEQGYVSIGDWHSSRALVAGESAADARNTRFNGKFEECGLHAAREPPRVQPKTALEILEPMAQANSKGFVTVMVKKRLENGEMCGKCRDVQAKLEEDGLSGLISGVSIADLKDPSSDGLVLAGHFNEEKAPFFVVKDGRGSDWKVIYSYGQWKKATKAALGP